MDIELIKEFIDYDPETGIMIWKKVLSNRVKPGDQCGKNIDSKGYARVCFDGNQYRAHRVAWAIYYGEEPHLIIDHINGNRLDNRIKNLRQATNSQNCRNCRLSKNNHSGVTGVTFHKGSKKWLAQITFNRENLYLGLFEDKQKAIEARKEAEKKYFGIFAFLD